MTIAATQLTRWSNQGATTTSAAAYDRINRALNAAGSPLVGRGVEIFLQGSYRNATNIRADSDIDVVVFYEDTFHSNKHSLPSDQLAAHEATYSGAAYTWEHLRDETLAALRATFGWHAVVPGPKAIKVQTGVGNMEADVLPAVQHRRYAHFRSRGDHSAHWGITFRDSAGNWIVNYPKYHIDRGQAKNSAERTNGNYKPSVRVVKNLRNWLADNNLLDRAKAPSYFIECALHNVPDHIFIGSFETTIPAAIEYLANTSFDSLMCQNGVDRLIGTGRTQWRQEDFVATILALQNALN